MTNEVIYLDRDDVEKIASTLTRILLPQVSQDLPDFILLGGEETGGALLDSALNLPRQPYYPSVEDKAAVLLRSLIKNHALVDGNKRIAVACTMVFLVLNGRMTVTSQEDLLAFAVEVAASNPAMSWQKVAVWLSDHIIDVSSTSNDDVTAIGGSYPEVNLNQVRDILHAVQLLFD